MADILSKKLYDKDGNQFYPESDARYIVSTALNPQSQSVSRDIIQLFETLLNALKDVSGGSQIEGDLKVYKRYCISRESTESGMINDVGDVSIDSNNNNSNWSSNFLIPSTSQPYAWVAMVFTWKDIALSPIYFISAILAFDKTLIMYTAIGNLSGDQPLGGPLGYNTTTEVSDANYPSIKWSYYFPGIQAGTPYGYMAVRHIPVGTQESDARWEIALFAQYPGT